MEVNLGFCGYHGYQIAFFRTITAAESQDCVVPDTLPDIASIMYTSGCVLIRSKDVSDGHIRMEANVPARVFCRGDGERRDFCLDVNIPFYLSAEDDAITEGSVCTAALKLRHLETRMLNPRKVSVRAEISVDLTCYSEENALFCTAPEEESGNIHVLEQEAELTAIESITEKTFVLTDEYELPSDRSSAAEIISQDADIIVQELRSVGSKLILKGTAHSALICRMENGEPEQLCFQTAFSQIIETETGTEDALFGTQMMMSGMYYELTPGADGRSISMELHLVAQAVALDDLAQQLLAAGVEVGRVEIVHARLDRGEDLKLGLFLVDGSGGAGEAHAAEAQNRDLRAGFVCTVAHGCGLLCGE